MNLNTLLRHNYIKTAYPEQNGLITYSYEMDINRFIEKYINSELNCGDSELLKIIEDNPDTPYETLFGSTVLIEYIPSLDMAQWNGTQDDDNLFFVEEEFFKIKNLSRMVSLVELAYEKEFVYSINESFFYDADELINIINDDYTKEEQSKLTIKKGIKEIKIHEDFVNTKFLIEDICDRAYEFLPDFSDNYINDMEKDKVQSDLNQLILTYLNDNVRQPGMFSVNDIEEITMKEFISNYSVSVEVI